MVGLVRKKETVTFLSTSEHDDWEISHFRRSQEDMHRLRTMTDELLRGVNHTLRGSVENIPVGERAADFNKISRSVIDIFFLHCWCCAAEHVPQSLVNSSTQGNGPSSPASTVSVNYADLDDQPDQLDEE